MAGGTGTAHLDCAKICVLEKGAQVGILTDGDGLFRIWGPMAANKYAKEMRFNEVAFTYSDWRDVNGVKFPFAVDEDRTGGGITQSFAIYTEKIEVNVPMDDAIFALPGSK